MTSNPQNPPAGNWTKENLARLGSMPDHLLGLIVKLPTAEVRAMREARGIPRYVAGRTEQHLWTPDDISLLGNMTDAAAAARIGTSHYQVLSERLRRDIPVFRKKSQRHQWLPEHDAMLGVKFDAEVAALLGISPKTVRIRRAALGISRQRGSGIVKGGYVAPTPEEIWTPEAIAKLGTISDSLLCAILRIPSQQVRAKRESMGIPRFSLPHPQIRKWTAEEIALIGTMPDSEVARKLGISRSQVEVRRKKMGIPRFVVIKQERAWLPEEDAMLGVLVDAEVAANLGINRLLVQRRRKKLGIPRQFHKGKNKPKRRWLPEEEAMLGVLFDSQVAHQLGIPCSEVSAHRRELGIPRLFSNKKITPL